jgi:hypothetical protein
MHFAAQTPIFKARAHSLAFLAAVLPRRQRERASHGALPRSLSARIV